MSARRAQGRPKQRRSGFPALLALALACLVGACSATVTTPSNPPPHPPAAGPTRPPPDRFEFGDGTRKKEPRAAGPVRQLARTAGTAASQEVSAELTVTQSLYALPATAALCASIAHSEAGVAACLLAAVGATGLVTAELSRGMKPGQAQMVESAGPWLVAAGARLALVSDFDAQDAGAVVAGVGYVGGPLLGAWLASFDPHSGTVALANSAGLWTAMGIEFARIGWSGQSTANFRSRNHGTVPSAIATLVGSGLGIAGGALLGRELRPARADVWGLDGLALLGLAIGAGIGNAVSDRNGDDAALARGGTVGMLAGAAVGLWLLPGWRGPALPPLQPLVSVGPGGEAMVGVGGGW